MADSLAFRVEPAILYVDESGQMRGPRPGDPAELPLLGSLLIPDDQRSTQLLRSLVAKVRTRLDVVAGEAAHFKAARKDRQSLEWIAEAIHDNWMLGHHAIELHHGDSADLTEMFSQVPPMVERVRPKLGADAQNPELELFLSAWAAVPVSMHVYMAALYNLFRGCAQWFRRGRTLPRLRVFLDEKMRAENGRVLNFLLRFATWVEFPEVYSTRRGAVLGVRPWPELQCFVSSDDAEDGIKIADVIAFARRMELGASADAEEYAEFLRACTRAAS